jgi:hypothetical protein
VSGEDIAVWQLVSVSCRLLALTRFVCIHRDFSCLFFKENGTIPFYRRFLKKVFRREFREFRELRRREAGRRWRAREGREGCEVTSVERDFYREWINGHGLNTDWGNIFNYEWAPVLSQKNAARMVALHLNWGRRHAVLPS